MSGTQEHPAPKDAIKALLNRLVEKGGDSAWAHFETVAAGGYFKNLLHGKQPWVEVAFVDEQSLQLSPGVPKSQRDSMPAISWPQQGKGLWTVPMTEIPALIEWVDKCLGTASGNAAYQVTGWIDGL
jgi:hypothetical protein